jgi:Holliday junction resolvase-like predicted endonuclease
LRLARAFDQHGVWFVPNARGRVGVGPRRCTREIDLLVNVDGWWIGIEVDGAPYHPAERAVDDHRRDRLFRTHGLWVEHYDAEEVFARPDGIVAETIMTSEAMRRSVGW